MQLIINFNKTFLVVLYDFLMAYFALYMSLYLRLGSTDIFVNEPKLHIAILIASAVQSLCFYFFGLYRGIWRFSSTPDLVRVIKGVSLAILLSVCTFFLWNRLENFPRTSFAIDWLLLIVTLGGGRFSYRMWKDNFSTQAGIKILVIGAGRAGERIVREIINNPSFDMKAIGFIDDDPLLQKKTIHNVPVLGKTNQLLSIIKKHKVDQIFIAIPSASSNNMRRIVKLCIKTKIKFKTLPSSSDLLNNQSGLLQLRNVEAEDLLGRESIQLETDAIEKMTKDKIIFVTGAGGSIGSELCNQICKYTPKKLICFEQTEYFLYKLEQELNTKYPNIEIVPVIGDVRRAGRVSWALNKYAPNVVFHAAAYKHVPLLESNHMEAIYTNVIGTKVVAEESINAGVERFVMISTDKAVNPTNIMGTSKRIAEIVCQINQRKTNKTKFMVVRFGNVLGSSGSVIPLFKKQIQKGGPVTITHPNIERYFMSIPEATQLVMQAGTMGNGGEIFILEMGSPVKIVDLANQMITLAGLEPDKDIKIEYIGLRPGEKLYEELLANDEDLIKTTHPKLKIAQAREVTDNTENFLNKFLEVAPNCSIEEVRNHLRTLVPEYHEADSEAGTITVH